MSASINLHIEDNVAIISIDDGNVNAFSHALINAFNEVLDQLESTSAQALVLTGRTGILSGGFDLKVMNESAEARSALGREGIQLLLRLMNSTIPIVVACSGHAVALGAFLLLVADYRIGVQGDFKIGLNEVAIGIPMPQWGVEMCRTNISPNYYLRTLLNAELFNPEEAEKSGFLNELVNSEEELSSIAFRKAEGLTVLDGHAYKETKKVARMAEMLALEEALQA